MDSSSDIPYLNVDASAEYTLADKNETYKKRNWNNEKVNLTPNSWANFW